MSCGLDVGRVEQLQLLAAVQFPLRGQPRRSCSSPPACSPSATILRTREFLAQAAAFDTVGARSCYLHGSLLGGEQATPWRLTRHGVLLDLGPHLLDLLNAAVGPITTVRAAGDSPRWVELSREHADGATSQASLSGSVALPRPRTVVELFGPSGTLRYDTAEIDHAQCWSVLRAEFEAAVRSGRSPHLDVRHGVRLQELLDQAMAPAHRP